MTAAIVWVYLFLILVLFYAIKMTFGITEKLTTDCVSHANAGLISQVSEEIARENCCCRYTTVV